MGDKLDRRTFFNRWTVGLSAFLSMRISGISKTIKEISDPTTNMKEPIISVTPLGFQWDTQDPFLFFFHHEDF